MDELWLIGRILFCALFIASGAGMLIDLEGSTRYAAERGVGPTKAGVIATAIAFIVGGVSVVFGIWGDLGALLLIGACVVLFSFFARDTFGFGLPYTITDGAFNFR